MFFPNIPNLDKGLTRYSSYHGLQNQPYMRKIKEMRNNGELKKEYILLCHVTKKNAPFELIIFSSIEY